MIPPNTYINIMDQYYPAFKAGEYRPLNRETIYSEYREALKMAKKAGLKRALN